MNLKTKEQLPFKYFVVKQDKSQDWKDYIKWLDKEYSQGWSGDNYAYYGFDGNYNCQGTNCHNNLNYFINNPKVFTAKEFMDILREEEILYLEPNIYAKFPSSTKVEELFNKAKDNGVMTFSKFTDFELFLMISHGGTLFAAIERSTEKKEISPEEFEERLNNSIKAMKTEEKEIIGYKAPQDFYNGQVKKGDIVICGSVEAVHGSSGNSFPKEIVEQWEPVYKVVFKEGDWVTIDVKLVEKYKPNHVLLFDNKYKLTQKLKDNNILGSFKDHYDWKADCWLNSKWFRLATPEEIDLSQEEVVDMGGFDVVVSPNGIFHKHDNITEFCKGLYDYNATLLKELGGYGLKFSDISFTKTGCQDNVTKLDAWVGVYTKYLKKQKS